MKIIPGKRSFASTTDYGKKDICSWRQSNEKD